MVGLVLSLQLKVDLGPTGNAKPVIPHGCLGHPTARAEALALASSAASTRAAPGLGWSSFSLFMSTPWGPSAPLY